MSTTNRSIGKEGGSARPYRVRVPGFLADEEVGLGDFLKRATSVVGVNPCGGCAKRAAMLNRRIVLSPRRSG